MDDLRLGRLLRAARLRRGWRQADVVARAGVGEGTVSRLERGEIRVVTVGTLRRVAAALEVQIDLAGRWRGGEGERLLSRRHSALADAVAQRLRELGWIVRPEVSFSVYGERGVIELLAWHPAHRSLLVIELKTEIVDVGELLATFDRKRRLSPGLAGDLGWRPAVVSAWVVAAESTADRRRVAAHASLIRSALPGDGRLLRYWLADPATPSAGLAFWSNRHHGRPSQAFGPVRRARRATVRDAPARPGGELARRPP